MLLDPECIPCIIKQAYDSAKRFTTDNIELQFKIVKEACSEVLSIEENSTSQKFASVIQNIIEKYTGLKNPYKKLKEKNLKEAKRYIPYLETIVENSYDKLQMAVRAAIIGNIIDLGANPKFDIEYEVNRITDNNINLDALKNFKDDLKNSNLILYIGDNYEEALFDKILLKQLLPKKIVFAVRSKTILNDITLEDAKELGIDKICEVMESGSKIAGTDLFQCSSEFLNLFEKADLVIAKGQGNFETLLKVNRPIYFLFKVKCDVIARRSSLPVGTIALYLNNNKKEVSNAIIN